MKSARFRGGLILGLLLGTLPLGTRAGEVEPIPVKAPRDKALIVVRLPGKAPLWFGDSATEQTGPERVFLSPVLKPGKTYKYKVKSQWMEGGITKKAERHVVVAAGKVSVVDLNKPEPASKSDEPPTEVPPAPAPPRLKPKAVPPKEVPPEEGLDQANGPEPIQARSRTFLFTYDATVKDLPAGKNARIWIPLARSSAEQEVKLQTEKVPEGAKSSKGADKQYHNQMLFVDAAANENGDIPLQLVFRVTRHEVRTTGPRGTLVKVAPEEDIERYLEPDVKVPIRGKPLELIKGKQVPEDQFAAAKMLYDVVNKHMTYSKKGTGWGQGDAVWACASGYGNCTDFHSLFISLARAEKIPSKFEMGFAIPAKHGLGPVAGYHCWAWFHPQGRGWVPVDIAEANQNPSQQEYYFGNLTEDRVRFTTGRDIVLVPPQSGGPLNYFIYPYVEVDEQPYPADKVERHFSYQDISPNR